MIVSDYDEDEEDDEEDVQYDVRVRVVCSVARYQFHVYVHTGIHLSESNISELQS